MCTLKTIILQLSSQFANLTTFKNKKLRQEMKELMNEMTMITGIETAQILKMLFLLEIITMKLNTDFVNLTYPTKDL